MKTIKQFFRLLYINTVLAKNGLDLLIVNIHLFTPFRFIIYFNPWNWFRRQKLTRGEALRISLEQLGPLFVKFGQALSTRPDILPVDIAFELCKLQDSVPPFPSEQVLTIIEQTFGHSAFEMFEYFDTEVLASASIAQVHAARLKEGQEVVVKLLRPGMHTIIEQDLGLLKIIANLAERYWVDSRRFKPKEVVAEFERNLIEELDLQREAANAMQLRRNFAGSPLLYVPKIYWKYVRKHILVMERIYGIPVTDITALHEHRIDIKKLAERGLEIFFTQVFRDCFFHADMHPGNIFVSKLHPENPQYICVDFGIVGTLNDTDKRYLADNLLAFFKRDYRRVAQLHIESGWVSRNTRVDEFEGAIRTVCEPIFENPLSDISFAHLVLELFQVARRFGMEVQPQLVLLQKTLLAVEGLGRQLYPDLDLWTTAKPFMEKWVRQQIGPKALLSHLRENIPFFVEQLPHMPRLLYDVLLLNKEQQLQQIQHQQQHHTLRWQNALRWKNGFAMGLLVAMTIMGGLEYFKVLKPSELTIVAVTSAIMGVIGLWITRRRGFE